ncbi:hypothetical protein B0T22DRAFT_451263, partial [Podospora appendiculata]
YLSRGISSSSSSILFLFVSASSRVRLVPGFPMARGSGLLTGTYLPDLPVLGTYHPRAVGFDMCRRAGAQVKRRSVCILTMYLGTVQLVGEGAKQLAFG